jgi:hypothetical protein
MALQYLGLDARGSGRAPDASERANPPRTSKGKFLLLAVANIVALVLAGRSILDWKGAAIAEAVGWKSESVSKILPGKGVISGILHNGENPAIIIDGRVLHEGDTFGDYKIVKIHPDRVDIETHGQNITKSVGQ